MDFGNTKYYNQKKRVITLRKGKGTQAGYVTLNGARIVSRRPTIYYVMNNGAIRALSNGNISAIPSALKYKVLKTKAPKKAKNVGNTAALNVAKNAVKAKRVAGLVKARQVKANKAGLRALPGFGNNQNSLFNNNLAKKANKKLAVRAKKLSALEKARAAKKMHAKNLPGWYNTNGNLFGNKKNAAVQAVKQTNEKLANVSGVNAETKNAAAAAASEAAKNVTPANASTTQAKNIANAAANGAAAAVQALPVAERSNKNAVAAASAAGASQAANAAKNGNSTPSEAKNIGAAAGTAVKNVQKVKMN
jgi:hypothetical protein